MTDAEPRSRRQGGPFRTLGVARTAASLPLLAVAGVGLIALAVAVLATVAWPLVTFGMFGPIAGYWDWVLGAAVVGGVLLAAASVGLVALRNRSE